MIFGTGFEYGILPVPDGDVSTPTRVIIQQDGVGGHGGASVHTGDWCLSIESGSNNWIRFNHGLVAQTEIYTGFHVYPRNGYSNLDPVKMFYRIEVSPGVYEWRGARWNYLNDTKQWTAVDGNGANVVQVGTIAVQDDYMYIETRYNTTSGLFQLRVDGILDINTTLDAGGTIDYIYLQGGDIFVNTSWDNFCYGETDWPNDIRFEGIQPNSDVQTQFSTTGGTNFGVVDDIPPNEASYVFTPTSLQRDRYGVSAWDGTGKTPVAVVHWLQAWKDVAGSNDIKHLLESGVTVDIGSPLSVLVSPKMFPKIHTLDPNGSVAWTEFSIQGINIGQESV